MVIHTEGEIGFVIILVFSAVFVVISAYPSTVHFFIFHVSQSSISLLLCGWNIVPGFTKTFERKAWIASIQGQNAQKELPSCAGRPGLVQQFLRFQIVSTGIFTRCAMLLRSACCCAGMDRVARGAPLAALWSALVDWPLEPWFGEQPSCCARFLLDSRSAALVDGAFDRADGIGRFLPSRRDQTCGGGKLEIS